MGELLTLDASEALYQEMLAHPELEERELICDDDGGENFSAALRSAINSGGGEPPEEWKTLHSAPENTTKDLPGGGKKLKAVKGMGTVYDWRDTNWMPPSGGRITARIGVQHIPVIRNVDGIGDLVTLRNVIVAQGLALHQGTDKEGNVALYCPGNRLCYQARGANQISWGTENMHYDISEPWSKRQLRASAWIVQLNNRHYGTGRGRASLGSGDGVVRVARGGQTTHARVSAAAGYHDRSDPGKGYDFEYVDHCITYFERYGHFEGA